MEAKQVNQYLRKLLVGVKWLLLLAVTLVAVFMIAPSDTLAEWQVVLGLSFGVDQINAVKGLLTGLGITQFRSGMTAAVSWLGNYLFKWVLKNLFGKEAVEQKIDAVKETIQEIVDEIEEVVETVGPVEPALLDLGEMECALEVAETRLNRRKEELQKHREVLLSQVLQDEEYVLGDRDAAADISSEAKSAIEASKTQFEEKLQKLAEETAEKIRTLQEAEKNAAFLAKTEHEAELSGLQEQLESAEKELNQFEVALASCREDTAEARAQENTLLAMVEALQQRLKKLQGQA